MPLGFSQWRDSISPKETQEALDKTEHDLKEDFGAKNKDEELSEDFSATRPEIGAKDVSILTISKILEWLKEINPNFDPFDMDSPYNWNCGSCAYAVYRRLEGDKESCAIPAIIPDERFMQPLTGLKFVSVTPEAIREHLLTGGDGAHTIIGIDRAFGPGHWFNAACVEGKVVAIDGQDGTISDWPPDYGDVINWEMGIKEG